MHDLIKEMLKEYGLATAGFATAIWLYMDIRKIQQQLLKVIKDNTQSMTILSERIDKKK